MARGPKLQPLMLFDAEIAQLTAWSRGPKSARQCGACADQSREPDWRSEPRRRRGGRRHAADSLELAEAVRPRARGWVARCSARKAPHTGSLTWTLSGRAGRSWKFGSPRRTRPTRARAYGTGRRGRRCASVTSMAAASQRAFMLSAGP